jgi:hypothetical protein
MTAAREWDSVGRGVAENPSTIVRVEWPVTRPKVFGSTPRYGLRGGPISGVAIGGASPMKATIS